MHALDPVRAGSESTCMIKQIITERCCPHQIFGVKIAKNSGCAEVETLGLKGEMVNENEKGLFVFCFVVWFGLVVVCLSRYWTEKS